MAAASKIIDLDRLVDDRGFGRSHVVLVLLCGLAALVDGFDAQLITYVAPSVARDLHLSRAALGPVFAMGIVGMVLGSLCGGMLADRFGRRPVILLALLWFGLFSILTAFSDSMATLIGLRLISGLGYGALMPNAAALVSEFAPQRFRATSVMVMYCGFPVGGALCGPIAALVLAHHDWHLLFVAGGAVSLVVAAVLAMFLPESIRFLLVTGHPRERVQASIRFIEPGYTLPPAAELVSAQAAHREKPSVRQLFGEGRALATTLLWTIFLSASLDLYFLVTWLPTLLQDRGVAARDSLLVTSMFQLGGLIFPLLIARLIDGRHAMKIVGTVLVFGAVTTFLIGTAGTSVGPLGLLVFLTGGMVQGGLTGLTAIAAGLYPTRVRSSGVGWALGISRVGGVVGPMLGAAAVGLPFPMIFALFAVPPLLAAGAAFGLSRAVREPAGSPHDR